MRKVLISLIVVPIVMSLFGWGILEEMLLGAIIGGASSAVIIPIAKNMAERVIGLIAAVAPQLRNSNITQRIIELEKKYAPLDWRVGFIIAAEVAQQIFCKFLHKLGNKHPQF